MNERRTTMTRREALTMGAGAVAAVATGAAGAEPAVPAKMPDTEWSRLRGFNYQPSYGSSGFELWQRFDATVIAEELARGKRHFPKMNALRWWQSWDSFLRDPKRYARDFETTLRLAEKVGCGVMPCLFNRWHDATLDYGGTYIDHFQPKVSWVQKPKMFDPFLKELVGGHKDDPRVLAWDLCNEPFAYSCPREAIPDIDRAESAWLKSLRDACKELGAKAPITIGIKNMVLDTEGPLCDVLSIHPYWRHNNPNGKTEPYEKELDLAVAYAVQAGKPLVATECCWGDLDDAARVGSIRYTLTQLKARNIGWFAYVLHHSLVADAHRPEFGPLSGPGNLAFIEADGSLRPGHGVFNAFP